MEACLDSTPAAPNYIGMQLVLVQLSLCQRHSAQRIANNIRNMQMIVLPAQTPAGEDLLAFLATRTMQSVRCAVFGRVTRVITSLFHIFNHHTLNHTYYASLLT